jgi:hypothetical protein
MIDALATVQAVGVTREGHVTGMVPDIPLEPTVAKTTSSDLEAFRQFVGEQMVGRNVTGALFVFVLTPDIPSCPPFPVCVLRRAHGVADDEVLDRLRDIPAMRARDEGGHCWRPQFHDLAGTGVGGPSEAGGLGVRHAGHGRSSALLGRCPGALY